MKIVLTKLWRLVCVDLLKPVSDCVDHQILVVADNISDLKRPRTVVLWAFLSLKVCLISGVQDVN